MRTINPIPLLLLWKTDQEDVGQAIRKATSASREEGGQGAERGGAHKSITVVSRWAWKTTGVPPPCFRAGLSCGLSRAGGFRGPVCLGDCPRQLPWSQEVAQRGGLRPHAPSPGEQPGALLALFSQSLSPSVTAVPL